MRVWALNAMLLAGMCCLLACLGKFQNKPEEEAADGPAANGNAAVQPAEEQPIDPRHQQRINAMGNGGADGKQALLVEDSPLDELEDEPRGTETGAVIASEHFVKRFANVKHQMQVDFREPIVDYDADEKEWSAFGVLKNKRRTRASQVKCFMFFNDENEWECRRILIDRKTVYHIDSSDQGFKLPNVKTKEDGKLEVSEVSSGDIQETDEPSDADKSAARKLKMAREFIGRKSDVAKKRLQEVIDDYPGTPAAKEAAELIKRVKD